MTELTLEEIDVDGAIREAEDRVAQLTRRGVLGAVVASGAGLLALGRPGTARAVTKNDVAILNYALSLEELQSAFYTEAERLRKLQGKARQAARRVGSVERAHVAAFRKALGRNAIRRPRYNFGGVTEDERRFLKTAVAFEDLAVAAYKAQAPRINNRGLLAVAVSIHSVEARHAAWMRYLFGIRPAAEPFDSGIEMSEILRIVRSTRFIAGSPARTTRRSRPRFTG